MPSASKPIEISAFELVKRDRLWALRFEKAFGVKADTLLRMQTAYDLARARESEAEIKVTRLGAVV